jgi:flavin reductase (DIM6/NTAB) family NADH-FMN oxidoreductase RutF
MEHPIDGLSETEAYTLFSQIVIPRPVAWVLTDNGTTDSRWNLAPFSYFNAVSSAPPMVMFSIGNGMAGKQKDTHANLTRRPECVIHIASVAQARALQDTADELPPGHSEVTTYGIELAEWDWPLPRVADSPIALGCVATQFTQIGRTEQILVFAEIRRLWLRPDVASVDANGRLRVDVAAVDPLARVGKGGYAGLTPVFWTSSR